MKSAAHRWRFLVVAAACLAAPVLGGTPGTIEPSTIEVLLRARRPDVDRWQLQPLVDNAPAGVAAVKLGRVAARTPVRFADGRVRWYAVEGFREVLVSTHRVDAGANLRAEDARPESRDVIALGCEPLLALAPARHWRARRPLAAGEALCASSVETTPEVERNSPVTLTASRGGIEVSRVLTAASDAHAGEQVRLNDSAKGVSLIGIVTGPGAARIAGEMR